MFSNYIKLAWRILGRKKFFTFISLFGISFTLGILMVIFSFLEGELGTDAPLGNKDDLVLIQSLKLQRVFYDTIPVIDTSIFNGVEVYDTTFQYNSRGSMNSNSNMNNEIGEKYLLSLPSAETATILSQGFNYDVYINGIKENFSVVFSDQEYWEIFDHQILEGRPFDQTEMDQGAQVTLISTTTAQKYFGTTNNVLNQEVLIDGKNYKVIGIYPDRSKVIPFVSPDMVMPYSNLKLNEQSNFYHGYFEMIFQKKSDLSAKRLKDEIIDAAATIPLDHPSKPAGYNEIVFTPETYNEMFAQGVYGDRDASKSLRVMRWVIIGLIVFFIVLPTLNLINLNVSRIMERSSEIGVRKAFGAHQSNIILQFIVENILQTLIGGIIGLGLALFFISFINKSGFLGTTTMAFNPKFFIYSFLITLLFGVISGLLPAYRMSRLNIVNALKEHKL